MNKPSTTPKNSIWEPTNAVIVVFKPKGKYKGCPFSDQNGCIPKITAITNELETNPIQPAIKGANLYFFNHIKA